MKHLKDENPKNRHNGQKCRGKNDNETGNEQRGSGGDQYSREGYLWWLIGWMSTMEVTR